MKSRFIKPPALAAFVKISDIILNLYKLGGCRVYNFYKKDEFLGESIRLVLKRYFKYWNPPFLSRRDSFTVNVGGYSTGSTITISR